MYYLKFQIIDQNVSSSNKIAGIFDHQYFWNASINISNFLRSWSVRRAHPCPDLPKLVRGDFDWFVVGIATLKIVQNERLINFLGSKNFFHQ